MAESKINSIVQEFIFNWIGIITEYGTRIVLDGFDVFSILARVLTHICYVGLNSPLINIALNVSAGIYIAIYLNGLSIL